MAQQVSRGPCGQREAVRYRHSVDRTLGIHFNESHVLAAHQRQILVVDFTKPAYIFLALSLSLDLVWSKEV